MIRRFLCKRNGEYWGFIYNNNVYDKYNTYRGWIEDNKFVWDENGKFLGELIDEHYIFRNKKEIGLSYKIPPERKEVNFKIISKKKKIAKLQVKGWVDILGKI